jgi:chromosome segregation ATPase
MVHSGERHHEYQHQSEIDKQLEQLKKYLEGKIDRQSGAAGARLDEHTSKLQEHDEKFEAQKDTWQEWLRAQVRREVDRKMDPPGSSTDAEDEYSRDDEVGDVEAMDDAAVSASNEKSETDAKASDLEVATKDAENASGEKEEEWEKMADWLDEPSQRLARKREHLDPFEQLLDSVFSPKSASTSRLRGARPSNDEDGKMPQKPRTAFSIGMGPASKMIRDPFGDLISRHFAPLLGGVLNSRIRPKGGRSIFRPVEITFSGGRD